MAVSTYEVYQGEEVVSHVAERHLALMEARKLAKATHRYHFVYQVLQSGQRKYIYRASGLETSIDEIRGA